MPRLWKQLILQAVLVSFIQKWYLETKVWEIGVPIVLDVSLFSGSGTKEIYVGKIHLSIFTYIYTLTYILYLYPYARSSQ